MENTDITKLIEVVILVIIAPFIPILANQFRRWLDANLSQQQQAALEQAVKLAVLATEQAGLNGNEARQYAVKLAEDVLTAQGLTIDANRLALVIEATVMSEFNKGRTAKGTNG